MNKYGIIISVVFAVGVLAGCEGTGSLKTTDPLTLLPPGMDIQNNKNGYFPVVPARTDFNPGLVIRGSLTENVLVLEDVVCRSLYPSVKPDASEVILNNSNLSQTNSFGFDLSLLEKLIGANKGSLKSAYDKAIIYNVRLGKVTEDYIPNEDKFDGANPLEVEPSCSAAINDLKAKGKFSDSVFVVSRALTVNGLAYDFSMASKASASLAAEVRDAVKATPSGRIELSTKGTNTEVSSDRKIQIGVRFESVATWLPSGAVSSVGANGALVKLVPVTGATVISIRGE